MCMHIHVYTYSYIHILIPVHIQILIHIHIPTASKNTFFWLPERQNQFFQNDKPFCSARQTVAGN